MAVRVYGVDRAPGVRVEEVLAPKPLEPGQVGSSYIVGAFRRGPVGGAGVPPVQIGTLSDLWRRRGVKVADHYAEQACRAFLDTALGGGALYTQRVCDGTQVAAALSLLTRKCPRGVMFRADDTLTPAALSVAVKWPGRDGGKRRTRGGLLALLANVTATTVTTGKTMLLDELAGGTLTLRGVSGKTYSIVSNTTGGVITVESDQTMAADLLADDPTNLYWFAETVNAETDEERGAVRRAVAFRVRPRGERRPAAEFGASVRIDGEEVQAHPDLSMVAATGRSEVEAYLLAYGDNHEVTPDNVWTGSDDPLARPANWAGIAEEGGLGATTVTLRVVEWQVTNGDPTGYVHLWQYGTDLRSDVLTLTFTGAGAFAVGSTLVSDLPAGTVGVAYVAHQVHPQTIGFTVVAGGTPFQAGDVITIRVKALPTDGSMAGAVLYPAGDGANAGVGFPVLSSTSRAVTVAAGYDLTAYGSEPDHAEIDTTSPGPWNTAAGSHGGPVTLTGITVDGAAVAAYTFPDTVNLTAAALKASWEAHDARLFATINADGTVSLGGRSTGSAAQFGYTGGTGIGVLMPAADSVNGTDGSLFLVEYDQEGAGGHDGIGGLGASQVVSALSASGSIREILSDNVGLIVAAAPGWAPDTVVSAGKALAQAVGGIYLPEFPITDTTEESAVTRVTATWGLSDFYAPVWPSWGYVSSRDGSGGQERVSLAGHVLGAQARSWASNGLGKAPAGTTTRLPGVLRLLKANDDVLPDAEKFNKAGIRAVTRRGGTDFVLWGDRLPGETEIWFHKRAIMGQILRELLYPGNFDQFVFERNVTTTWARINTAVRELLRPRYDAGWFNSDLAFDDACQIKVDSETTPPSVQAAGKVIVAVGIVPADTVEQIVFRLSKAGVAV